MRVLLFAGRGVKELCQQRCTSLGEFSAEISVPQIVRKPSEVAIFGAPAPVVRSVFKTFQTDHRQTPFPSERQWKEMALEDPNKELPQSFGGGGCLDVIVG